MSFETFAPLRNEHRSMHPSRCAIALIGPLAFGSLFSVAVRADITVPDEYGKTIKHHNEIATLTGEFGGDRIDLSTGRLDIVLTDIDLVGNNGLPVRVTRRFQPATCRALTPFALIN